MAIIYVLLIVILFVQAVAIRLCSSVSEHSLTLYSFHHRHVIKLIFQSATFPLVYCEKHVSVCVCVFQASQGGFAHQSCFLHPSYEHMRTSDQFRCHFPVVDRALNGFAILTEL